MSARPRQLHHLIRGRPPCGHRENVALSAVHFSAAQSWRWHTPAMPLLLPLMWSSTTSVNSSRTPSRKPVATVRRKSCNVHGTSGAATAPDTAAALARNHYRLVDARFACDQSPKGVPTALGRASVPARGSRRGRRRKIKNLKVPVRQGLRTGKRARRGAETKINVAMACGRREPAKGCPLSDRTRRWVSIVADRPDFGLKCLHGADIAFL